MAKRTSEDIEKKVIELAARGSPSKSISSELGIAERTVRKIIERAAKIKAAELPVLEDKRLTTREVMERIAHARDCCALALGPAVERVVVNLAAGRPAKDSATSAGILMDKLRGLDAYYRLQAAMTKTVPTDQGKREEAYIRLLWTLAANGSIAAARQLARAWGIEEIADRGTISVSFEDDASEEDQAPSPAATPA